MCFMGHCDRTQSGHEVWGRAAGVHEEGGHAIFLSGMLKPEGEGCLSAMGVPWSGEGVSGKQKGLVKSFLKPETCRFLKEPDSGRCHSFIHSSNSGES